MMPLMMPLYALTLFASALLLFLVQPMVGKMILPKLGGTPAVWNTCMVFFQAMLLAGYAYAHGTAAWLSTRRQVILHACVLAVPLAVLPIAVGRQSDPPATDLPIGWLLWQLLIGVGLPFFVVSSSAPLLQRWFAQTNHAQAHDPYFLYAASNTGSLIALLGYPLLVEPQLRLFDQSALWAWGYGAMAVLIVACGAVVSRINARCEQVQTFKDASPPITWTDRGRWLFLSAVPSSLMLGVTTYITTDLAAVPLMWVLPLAIYLLTFVIVFSRRPVVSHAVMVKLLPFLMLPMGILLFFGPDTMEVLIIPVHLVTFFVAAMVCHGELVRRRPAARHLTQFYLLMSAGGVIGGLFNAIVAPQVFTSIAEYPIGLVLACFALPQAACMVHDARTERRRDFTDPLVLAVFVAVAVGAILAASIANVFGVVQVVFLALTAAVFTFKARPVRFALGYVVMLVAVSTLAQARTGNLVHAERNFFGVKRVIIDPSQRLRLLVHGRTSHGCQILEPIKAHEPSSYYHRGGPIGDVFDSYNASPVNGNVGIVGLGVGALAAYTQPGQRFTFYEIDPGVERIARRKRWFRFLADCRGECDVVLGDGRLTVARVPDGHFGLFLLDAFSSDSVPTHLLSREAIELYLSKLADEGVLAFHVSNQFFDFEPLLARAADDLGLFCIARFEQELTAEQKADGMQGSHCVVMARRPQAVAALAEHPGWTVAAGQPDTHVWTDQYCDVVGLFLRGRQINLGPRAAMADRH